MYRYFIVEIETALSIDTMKQIFGSLPIANINFIEIYKHKQQNETEINARGL